jgi:hypothetical protein
MLFRNPMQEDNKDVFEKNRVAIPPRPVYVYLGAEVHEVTVTASGTDFYTGNIFCRIQKVLERRGPHRSPRAGPRRKGKRSNDKKLRLRRIGTSGAKNAVDWGLARFRLGRTTGRRS